MDDIRNRACHGNGSNGLSSALLDVDPDSLGTMGCGIVIFL